MAYRNSYGTVTPWTSAALARPFYFQQMDESYIPVPSECCVALGSLPRVSYYEPAAYAAPGNACCNDLRGDMLEAPFSLNRNRRYSRRY